MADSETSSDVKVNYQNARGENLLEDKNEKKPQSTDTDYYFNMIANPDKTQKIEKSESESSLHDLLKKTESDTSSSSSRSSKSSKSSSSRSRNERINIQASPVKPSAPAYKPENVGTAGVAGTLLSTAEVKPLTAQEIRMKKTEMIRKLCELKAKGYQLTKEYDFTSSLEEMEYEYELLRSFADKRNGVKLFRNGLLQAVSVIEFLNDKYDPFDFHLSGWGEHVSVEIESWEDVLEELYEKYKSTGKQMSPEIKLLYLIIASASAFHFTKSQAAKMPGLDAVLAANPGLLSKIMNPKKAESSQFMTPQEISIERQRAELKQKDSENKMKMQQQMQMQMQMQQMQAQIKRQQEELENQKKGNQTNTVNDILNSRIFSSEPVASNSKPIPQSVKTAELKSNRGGADIRAPDNVKDILSRIHNIQGNKPSNTDTQDETSSNNDRLVSESTFSESNPKKKQQRKGKKAAGLSIF